jgi:hypothetical protein
VYLLSCNVVSGLLLSRGSDGRLVTSHRTATQAPKTHLYNRHHHSNPPLAPYICDNKSEIYILLHNLIYDLYGRTLLFLFP